MPLSGLPSSVGDRTGKVVQPLFSCGENGSAINSIFTGAFGNGSTAAGNSSFTQYITQQFSKTSRANGTGAVLSIKSDGTLWAWANNFYGQYGNGTTTTSTSPVQIGTSTWNYVSCGGFHTVAIKSDGTLWAWGQNTYGQLGDGSTTTRLSPVQIGSATWTAVSCGLNHTLAIKSDGTLWAWGFNVFGQLGDGTQTGRLSPVQIGNATWTALACGSYHSLAIKSDRTLWSWGSNDFGQAGGNAYQYILSPQEQSGAASWISISAGDISSFAVGSDGSLWAWGYNGSGFVTIGCLGLGDYTDRSDPTLVGSDTDWLAVYSGSYHAFGVKTNGALYAWGQNRSGQLGLGSTNTLPTLTPTLVSLGTGNSIVIPDPMKAYVLDYDTYYGYYYDYSTGPGMRIKPFFSSSNAIVKYQK